MLLGPEKGVRFWVSFVGVDCSGMKVGRVLGLLQNELWVQADRRRMIAINYCMHGFHRSRQEMPTLQHNLAPMLAWLMRFFNVNCPQ